MFPAAVLRIVHEPSTQASLKMLAQRPSRIDFLLVSCTKN